MEVKVIDWTRNNMLKKPLTLPVYHYTEETAAMDDAGIEYDARNCEVREIIFYQINALSIHRNIVKADGIDTTHAQIHANGSVFISPLSPLEASQRINNNINGK